MSDGDMVERVARAICLGSGQPPDGTWHNFGERPVKMWESYVHLAKAAIRAAALSPPQQGGGVRQ